MEFDYKNESIKTQSVVIYDKNGTTLASYTDKYSLERFEPIIPGSIGEKIFYATFAEYQNKCGEAKFSKQGYDIEFSLKTQGLIEKGIQYYERVLKENIDPSELKDEIEQLKIKDPTGIPRV